MSIERIRLIVGDDEYLIREALQHILANVSDVDVVGFCTDADSLLAAVEEEEPNAVLTDIRMPPTHTDEGIRVAQTLRASHPSIGVVALSQFADPDYALALLDAGSAGRAYLLKERVSEPAELIAAIKAVVEGGSVIDPKVVEVLVRARSFGAQSPLASLTPREREVLAELAQGKSNAAIASSLVLTKRAVEKHINSIFLKLELPSPDDVSRRVKAALLFLASGESQPPVSR
ncbi:MAG: response regulator transcription factor [Solirubrobacteraceae bacterium]